MGPRYGKIEVVLMWHHISPIVNHPRSIKYCSLVQENIFELGSNMDFESKVEKTCLEPDLLWIQTIVSTHLHISNNSYYEMVVLHTNFPLIGELSVHAWRQCGVLNLPKY